MFAQNQGFHLGRAKIQLISDQGTETGGVQHGSQPQHLILGNIQFLNGDMRQNIHWIGNDKEFGTIEVPGSADAIEDAAKKADIAIDQIQA